MDIRKILEEYSEYSFIKKPILNKNIAFLCFGGSTAYGLNGPQSDIDIRGVLLPTKDNVLNFDKFVFEENSKDKNIILGNGVEQYNDSDTDTVIYSLNKAFNLFYSCNPNSIEMLGCLPEHYYGVSEAGKLIIENSDLFLSKRAYNSFGGYARAQFSRLKNALAKDNLPTVDKQVFVIDSINRLYSHLEEVFPTFKKEYVDFYIETTNGEKLSFDTGNLFKKLTFKNEKNETIDIESESINTELKVSINIKGMSMKDISGVYNEISHIVKDFGSYVGHRNKKKDDYHLCKHAMHLIRLYFMAIDILSNNKIITYRVAEHELLMSIKNGEFQNEDGSFKKEFFDIVNHFENELQKAYKKSSLPEIPNLAAINDLYRQLMNFIVA